MSTSLASAVDALRRPEHTGENRCVPCTVVNVLIAVLLSAAVAAVARPLGPGVAVLLGSAVLVVSVVAIYVRGYLVPGTPRITRTYFPDWLLRRFEKGETVRPGPVADLDDAEGPLKRAGVVTDCEHGLCLTDEFRAEWRNRIATIRESDADREEFVAVFQKRAKSLSDEEAPDVEIEPEQVSFERFGDALVALVDHVQVDKWESRGAFVAEVAAAGILQDQYDGWTEINMWTREDVLRELRAFLESCPVCDGPIAPGDEPVESCCRSVDNVIAMTCTECGIRVFETERANLGP